MTSAVAGNGLISFKLAGNSGDRVSWRGRTHISNNPELVIVTDGSTPTETPTPTNTPIDQSTSTPTPTHTPEPPPPPTDPIVRKTYTLAGQPIAVRITGDPEASNNGLFFHATDHLDSVLILTNHANNIVDVGTRTLAGARSS